MNRFTSLLIDWNPILFGLEKIFQKYQFPAKVADYLRNLIYPNYDLRQWLFFIGSMTITLNTFFFLRKTFKTWNWALTHFKNLKAVTQQNLKSRYGNCWVAITGFTQGIGWGFAELFAKMGFNLLLIGRNQQLSQQRCKHLQSYYPKISKHVILGDLSTDQGINKIIEGFNKIKDQIDLGIFINNAGMASGGYYLNIQPINLLKTTNVNITNLIKLTKQVIPVLRARQKRSALINVSSCTGYYLSPNIGIYSTSKKMLDIYTRILDKQNSDKIDIISPRPFGVTTKMMKMKKGPFMITPADCTKSCIGDLLAGQKTTFTGAKHKITHGYLQWAKNEDQVMKVFNDLWKKSQQVQQLQQIPANK